MNIKFVRCPDCEYEERLRNDGGAKVIGGQLRGVTVDVGVTKASSGCRTCKGRGAISTDDLEAMLKAGVQNPAKAHLDPYSYGIKPSVALTRKPSRSQKPVQ